MKKRRTFWENGAALVEFALVLPVLLILLFGVIDFGRLAFTQINLNEAVQEGSIYASTHPNDPSGSIIRVVGSVDSPTIAAGTVSVSCEGDVIKVSIAHPVTTITPLLLPDTVTLTASVVTDRFSEVSCVAST